VVATTGAIPRAPKGYAAAILLDANALLARPELRASEKAFAAWRECVMAVTNRATGGQVVIVGDDSTPAVQALIRHDPTGFAQSELKLREQVALTPAVRMAALTGPQSAIDSVVAALQLPADAILRGPIPVNEEFRLFVCVPRAEGAQMATKLRQINAARSAKHEAKVNVRIDPVGLL
jgi:primosomal protein N' (replication factor Y)